MAGLGRIWSARLAGLLLSSAVPGCKAAPSAQDTPRPAPAPTLPAQEAQGNPAGSAPPPGVPRTSLRYAEIATGGARIDEPAPLVIALHGLGDRPENFLGVFNRFTARAHVVAPHSEMAHGPGFTWFEGGLTDEAAPNIQRMANTIVKFASEMAGAQATLGKPIVMGFSQGGALSFEIGVHHPEAVAATFPVGGWLTPALWPSARPPAPIPLTLFHGTADTVVPFGATKTAVAALQKLGFPIELHEYEGVGHGISSPENSDLLAAIAAECEKQEKAGSRGVPVPH